LTNSNGTVTDEYEYDAYGNSFTKSGTTPNNYLYRGEQYDSDLGLYYLRARYYNPATGRFLSRDPEAGKPIDPKTLHKYLYANGDPINGIDPMGREDLVEYVTIAAKATFIATTVICGEIELINHLVEWTLHKEGFPSVMTKPCDLFSDIVFVVALIAGGLTQ
jgi:RHS repeat-associated protein